jgi:peptidoglycan hydrolase CwlO-like protein
MILAERDVFNVLKNAESERRAGCATTDADALQSALTEALSTIRELNSDDMKSLRRNLERADIKIARLEDEVGDAEHERDDETERADGLSGQLSEAESKIEDLESKIEDLESKIAELESRLSESEA